MELVILEPGIKAGRRSRRIIIKKEDKIIKEIPVDEIESVIIGSHGVSLSSDFIFICAISRIPVILLTNKGEIFGEITGPYYLSKPVLRIQQMKAVENGRGRVLAQKFIYAKLKNQINLLKYFSKSRRESHPEIYLYLRHKAEIIEENLNKINEINGKDFRQKLFNIEGLSAHHYWDGVKTILPDYLKFPGRRTFNSNDLFNSALNYGYGVLYSRVWSIVLRTGLDPFTGFLHAIQDGKPSFIYDFVEEFRTMIVDKTLISMATKGFKFKFEKDKRYLDKNSRKEIVKHLLLRLEDEEKYKNRNVKIKDLILYKSYEIIKEIKGIGRHIPYVGEW